MPRLNKRRTFHKMNQTLGPKPNVEIFMRRTKLIELTSWKVRRLAQLSSSEWIWIVQHVLFVCSRRIERLKIVSGTNVDFHMRRTKLTIKHVYHNVYLASFRRKFLTDLITGRPPSVSGGRCWLKSEQRSFVIYRRNTYEQYGGYNLFQNAEFKANFSITVWGKC